MGHTLCWVCPYTNFWSSDIPLSEVVQHEGEMAKEEPVEVEGEVTELLRSARFRVKLDGRDDEIVCTISGKIRKNRIRIEVRDRVKVELTQYDLNRGRITYRID